MISNKDFQFFLHFIMNSTLRSQKTMAFLKEVFEEIYSCTKVLTRYFLKLCVLNTYVNTVRAPLHRMMI